MSNNSDFLAHYGVLGMKWGVRRYQNKDGTRTKLGLKRDQDYRYTSAATKRRMRKADRAEAKGKENAAELRKRAEASQELDDKMLDYAKNTSVAKAFLQNFALGMSSKTYLIERAQEKDRASSWLNSALPAYVGGIAGTKIWQRAEREDYINRSVGKESKKNIIDKTYDKGKEKLNTAINAQSKESKIQRAKEKDSYELDFLEAVQNYNLPKNVMIKEYSKYLDSNSYSDYANEDMDKRLKKYKE